MKSDSFTFVLSYSKIRQIHTISKAAFDKLVPLGLIEPIEDYERTAVIFENMERTGIYLQEQFQEVQDRFIRRDLLEEQSLLGDNVVPALSVPLTNAGGVHCSSTMKVEVNVVSNKRKSFASLVTNHGQQSTPDFVTLVGIDVEKGKEVNVTDYQYVEMSKGRLLITITDPSMLSFKVFVFTAGFKDLSVSDGEEDSTVEESLFVTFSE